MSDIDEEPQPRPHVRRRKSCQDWVTTTGGLIAIAGTFVAVVAWAQDQLPFVKSEVYAEEVNVIRDRMSIVEGKLGNLQTGQNAIQRNGLLTLQLQLQQRVDALDTTLKTMPQDRPTHYQIVNARNEAVQQLEEIKRQLGR